MPSSSRTAASSLIILLLALFVLSLYFLLISLNLPYDDDVANLVVLGRDFLRGNLLLKGWSLTTQSFLTTEVPAYALGVLLLGFNSRVIYALTGLHWGLIALLVIYLASTDEDGRLIPRRLFISICVSAILGLLLRVAPWLSFGHLVAFIYSLAALLCLRKAEQTPRWIYLSLFGLLSMLALIGDPFTLYFLLIPVAAACIGRLIINGPARFPLLVLASALASFVLAQAALWLIQSAGGVTISGLSSSLVPMSKLGANLREFIAKLLHVFGVNLYGASPFSITGVVVALRLLTLLLFMLAFIRIALGVRRRSLYVQILLAIVLLNLLENILNPNVGSARYYAPIILFGIILVTDVIDGWPILQHRRALTTAALTLILLSYLQPPAFSRPATEFDDLARQLTALDLRSGYGPYWRSHVITVATEGQVVVRPVGALDGGIAPYAYGANRLDYESYGDFLIVPTEAISDSGLTVEAAVRVFGEPAQTRSIPGYGVLLIWDHDLSPTIAAP